MLTCYQDLDRFEMASQGMYTFEQVHIIFFCFYEGIIPAFEYEKNHEMKTLQPFFDSSLPNIRHPEVQQWGEDLTAEREQEHN